MATSGGEPLDTPQRMPGALDGVSPRVGAGSLCLVAAALIGLSVAGKSSRCGSAPPWRTDSNACLTSAESLSAQRVPARQCAQPSELAFTVSRQFAALRKQFGMAVK